MSVDYLFLPLSPDRDVARIVPVSAFCETFSKFGIDVRDYVPELIDGTHQFDYYTEDETLSDEAGFSIKDGAVASFFIHRPNDSPESRQLWLALLNLGFVMLPDSGGVVFASSLVAREVTYLKETVRVVEQTKDFVF